MVLTTSTRSIQIQGSQGATNLNQRLQISLINRGKYTVEDEFPGHFVELRSGVKVILYDNEIAGLTNGWGIPVNVSHRTPCDLHFEFTSPQILTGDVKIFLYKTRAACF
jgi:hypothetical protein